MSARSSLYFRRAVGGRVAIEDMARSCGQRLFVCSGTGTDGSGYGFSPEKPLATLLHAISHCEDHKGDIVYLMPGHAEAIAAATSAVIDKAGVEIIGLGRGSLQPTFTLGTATTATMSVTAHDVLMRNFKVISNLADVAVGITLGADADGAAIEDCLFCDGGLTKELKIAISVAAGCSNVAIRRSRFFADISAGTGATTSAIFAAGAADYFVLEDCFFHGHYIGAAVDLLTAASASVFLRNNAVINIDTDAGLTIAINAGTTGFGIGNDAFGLKDTVHLTAAAMAWSRNYDSNALNASAIIKPAIDS
jgi:hypothetical protein